MEIIRHGESSRRYVAWAHTGICLCAWVGKSLWVSLLYILETSVCKVIILSRFVRHSYFQGLAFTNKRTKKLAPVQPDNFPHLRTSSAPTTAHAPADSMVPTVSYSMSASQALVSMVECVKSWCTTTPATVVMALMYVVLLLVKKPGVFVNLTIHF